MRDFLLVLCLGLVVRADFPAAHPAHEVLIKSRSDSNSYRRFVLGNGVDVMLASSSSSGRTAVSVDVGAGWWHEPDHKPGLAHLLEHMLFLGNRAYPGDDWAKFMQSSSGSSNAYTSSHNINFQASVSSSYTEAMIERVVQFFIAPEFDIAAIRTELVAVDSENQNNQLNDEWRQQQLIQSISNPAYPYKKFGTGSLSSLGNVPTENLQAALQDYFETHFFSHKIRVALVSPLELDDMERLVRTYFSQIPSTKVQRASITAGFDPVPLNASEVDAATLDHGISEAGQGFVDNDHAPESVSYDDISSSLFLSDVTASLLQWKTIKQSNRLSLIWALPPQGNQYERKSIQYISSLLSDQSTSSLTSSLRRKNLASSVQAGSAQSKPGFELFQIDVDLILDDPSSSSSIIKSVIQEVFGYISLIETSGVNYWRWKELSQISAVKFRFLSQPDDEEFASNLASEMPLVGHLDILMHNYLFRVYDAPHIRSLLQRLTVPSFFALFAVSSGNLTLREKWYGTSYNLTAFDADAIASFKLARSTPSGALPLQNTLIPSDFTIRSAPDPQMPFYPLVLSEVVDSDSKSTGSVRVWWKQDTSFLDPTATTLCKFWTPMTYSTPRDVVLAALFAHLISDANQERLFPAENTGFSYIFSAHQDGFLLSMSGFSDTMENATEILSKGLQLRLGGENSTSGLSISKNQFNIAKSELRQSYMNFLMGQPYAQANYLLDFLLTNPHWHVSQYLQAVQSITLEEVVSWSRGVFQDVALECLVAGNVKAHEAQALVQTIVNNVEFRSNTMASFRSSNQAIRVSQLDGSYVFTENATMSTEQNSAVVVYYQYEGEGNVYDDLFIHIVSRLIREPAYDQLRTREALGYIVSASRVQREGVLGVRILIQGAKKSARYLDSRIDKFMKKLFRSQLRKISTKKYQAIFRKLATALKFGYDSIDADAVGLWREIATQEYKFLRPFMQSSAALKLSQSASVRKMFLRWYDDLIGYDAVPSRLSVQIQARRGAATELPFSELPDSARQPKIQPEAYAAQRELQLPNADLTNNRPEKLEKLLRNAREVPSMEISAGKGTSQHRKIKSGGFREEKVHDRIGTKAARVRAQSVRQASGHVQQKVPAVQKQHANPDSNGKSETHIDLGEDEFESFLEMHNKQTDEMRLVHCDVSDLSDNLCQCATRTEQIFSDEPADCEGWQVVRRAKSRRRPLPLPPLASDARNTKEFFSFRQEERDLPQSKAVGLADALQATPASGKKYFNPVPCAATVTSTFVKYCNGTIVETQARACGANCTYKEDSTCNKGGEREWHAPRPATIGNVIAFKDALCVFPKRPLGLTVPTKAWWLRRHPYSFVQK